MTAAEAERLAVVEEKVDALDSRMARIESKLDAAITCKADKTEVADLRKLVLGVVLSVSGVFGVTLLGIAVYALQQVIAKAMH